MPAEAETSMVLATGNAQHADGSYVRTQNRSGAGTPDMQMQMAGATPYNSHPDMWALTMGEKLPNTSPGLKRQRHARLCGHKNPGASAKAHWEFTERDAWPEYVPESCAAPARRWTGVAIDGYQESSESVDVRRCGWQMGVQRATMDRAGDGGVTRSSASGSRWFTQHRWNERTGTPETYVTSRMVSSKQAHARPRAGSADMWRGKTGQGSPFSPEEWRSTGLASAWSDRPVAGWRGVNPKNLLAVSAHAAIPTTTQSPGYV